jgi:DNA-directed RNA polymerase specialized sigma24 family protein
LPNISWKDSLAKDILESNLREYCRNLIGTDYADDVFSDSLLKMFKIPNSKLKDIYDRGKHLDYFFLVVRNMSYNHFRKMKRYPYENMEDSFDMIWEEYHEYGNEILEAVNEWAADRESGWWYHARLIKLYAEEGSIKRVHQKTKIPQQSVSHSLKEFRQWMKEIVDEMGIEI